MMSHCLMAQSDSCDVRLRVGMLNTWVALCQSLGLMSDTGIVVTDIGCDARQWGCNIRHWFVISDTGVALCQTQGCDIRYWGCTTSDTGYCVRHWACDLQKLWVWFQRLGL